VKNTIIYAVAFLLAFVGTTTGLYIFNSKYANIFEFDFRDPAVVEAEIADSLAVLESDSLVVSETTIDEINTANLTKQKELEDNLKITKKELGKVEQQLTNKDKQIEQLKMQLKQQQDTEHEEWLKSTIKLYESMNTAKAGALLNSLPEKEARELIYSMKKKKAAEILSNLNTETVKRLTRAKK